MTLLPVSLDTVKFTRDNAWDYLLTLPLISSSQADSLVINYTVSGEGVEKVGVGNAQVGLEVLGPNVQRLASIAGPGLAAEGRIDKVPHRFGVNLKATGLADKAQLSFKFKFTGFTPKELAYASLGNIYDFNKTLAKSGFEEASVGAIHGPESPELLVNYPNPFNPETTITYRVERGGSVHLAIYNILGEKIRTLVDGPQAANTYQVRWDSKNSVGQTVPSGVYVMRLNVGERTAVRKITLLK